MKKTAILYHDLNCELAFEVTCKCLVRDSERVAYSRAKNDALESLGWLVREAHLLPQPLEGSQIRSNEDKVRHAVTGYPTDTQTVGETSLCDAPAEEISRLAGILLAAWTKAEPNHLVTLYPTSYLATFTDMAKAILSDRS